MIKIKPWSQWLARLGTVTMLAVVPVSPNYQLKSYTFTGEGQGTSANYQIEGEMGVGTGNDLVGPNYSVGSNQLSTQLADVPTVAMTNPSHDYYQLHLVLTAPTNPADAEFAVAVSTDGFVSDTKYVQSDNSVGAVLGAEDWRTSSSLGSGSGIDITGLRPTTTYTVKAKARDGTFTETTFGPTVSLITASPSLTMSSIPASVSYQIAPEVEDTAAVPISIQTNADQYTLKVYADNGASGANPRDATTGSVIANQGGFSPVDVNTPTAFTSGSGMGYRVSGVTGSEVSEFAANGHKSLAYGTLGSHSNAVSVMQRISTRPQWATDLATLSFKLRADYSIPASSNYQTTVYFDLTPTYDGL